MTINGNVDVFDAPTPTSPVNVVLPFRFATEFVVNVPLTVTAPAALRVVVFTKDVDTDV